jgi:hypothetical protein
VYDEPDGSAKPWPIGQQPWPIGQQGLAAVKEEPSLQPSHHSSFAQANSSPATGVHGGWQQQQQPRRQQQQQLPYPAEDEYGRSECLCKGCVIC